MLRNTESFSKVKFFREVAERITEPFCNIEKFYNAEVFCNAETFRFTDSFFYIDFYSSSSVMLTLSAKSLHFPEYFKITMHLVDQKRAMTENCNWKIRGNSSFTGANTTL